MLRQHIARLAAGVTVVAACVLAIQNPAMADYIYCPPDNGPCIIVNEGSGGGGNPGDPNGGGSGNVGEVICRVFGKGVVPCYDRAMGWFNLSDECYYTQLTLPDDDPLWNGHNPADGDIYAVYCWGGDSAGWLVRYAFRTSEPPGYGGLPSLIQLVWRAIRELPLDVPVLGTAPKAAGTGAVGLVGLPVWLWVENRNWGPTTASASGGGITVVATGTVTHMDWRMGDGTTVRCPTQGTPYNAGFKDQQSPDCGHSKYLSPGRYTVRGTVVWRVEWRGGGQQGVIPVQRFSEVDLQINELQVVVR